MRSEKRLLRQAMRQALVATLAYRDSASADLCAQIQALPHWGAARTVGLFYPLPEEPDLLGLLADRTKRFVFPIVREDGLQWRAAAGEHDFQTRDIGTRRPLMEPSAGQSVEARELDLLLVPGLAFTLSGGRLGRGGGYYDRALTTLREDALSVGVCFACQLVDVLPLEDHDQVVQRVLCGR